MLRTESKFGKEGDDEDRHHVAKREELELHVRVTVVAHAIKHDARKHDGNAEQHTHVQTV